MADNITILDGAAASTNWATTEGSDSQHRQHVVPTDGDGAAAAHADAAAFTRGSDGVLSGLAGLYESGILANLTTGTINAARVSAAAAILSSRHVLYGQGLNTGISGELEIQSSSSAYSGYAEAVAGDFDYTNFPSTAAFYYLFNCYSNDISALSLAIENTLDTGITYSIKAQLQNAGWSGAVLTIASGTLSTGQGAIFTPGSLSLTPGSRVFSVPQLAGPLYNVIVGINCTSVGATSGQIRLGATGY